MCILTRPELSLFTSKEHWLIQTKVSRHYNKPQVRMIMTRSCSCHVCRRVKQKKKKKKKKTGDVRTQDVVVRMTSESLFPMHGLPGHNQKGFEAKDTIF